MSSGQYNKYPPSIIVDILTDELCNLISKSGDILIICPLSTTKFDVLSETPYIDYV